MYSRIYPQKDGIPPNYKGNAFDNIPSESICAVREEKETAACENRETKEGISSLLTRRDGKRFELDDLILGGLIILLLNSHADDELLLILVLLFVAGL